MIDINKSLEMMRAVPRGATKQEDKQFWGKTGTMDCTDCGTKGAVAWVRAKVNGHIHMGCKACGWRIMQ